MRIVFIKPNMFPGPSSDAMQPLAFAVLAGLTPSKHQIVFYDERLEVLPPAIHADIVALSVETFTAKRAYDLAIQYKRDGVHIVMGGYHPSFAPGEALRYCDTVFVGEAEKTWPLFLLDFEKGDAARIYRGRPEPTLEGICYDRSIFAGKRYVPMHPVQFGRSCRFSCEFCSVRSFYTGNPRYRPVNEVLEEIRRSKEKNIFIVDDNIISDTEKATELFRSLIPLKIRWVSQASADISRDRKLLELAAKSGCAALVIGFESLEPGNLFQMRKNVNIFGVSPEETISRLREHGIMVYGTFVFGYDHDTQESFESTLAFAVKNKLVLANFNPLVPMPGTPLYERLRRENRLLYPRWWLDSRVSYGDAMFQPAGMTGDELRDGCCRIRRSFNKLTSIFYRVLSDRKANSATLFNTGVAIMANLVSRKEIMRKQGVFLGGRGSHSIAAEAFDETYAH